MAHITSNDSFVSFLNSQSESARARVGFYEAVTAYFKDGHQLSEGAMTSRKLEVSDFIVSIFIKNIIIYYNIYIYIYIYIYMI